MNNLTKALMEELTVEYVKVGPLQIPESVVISWPTLTYSTVSSSIRAWVNLFIYFSSFLKNGVRV